MLPQIEFVYNKEYDDVYRDLWYLSNITGAKYPSDEIDIQEYINNHIKPIRNEYSEIILRKIEEIGIYKWTEKFIPIYVVGSAKGLWTGTTRPITITFMKNKDWILDTIVHELIHYYFELGGIDIINYYKNTNKIYEIEDNNMVIHLILYAIQNYIYKDIPNQRDYSLEILSKQNDKYKGFIKKAQDIGFEKIIQDYQEFINKKEQKINAINYPILKYQYSSSYNNLYNKIDLLNQEKNNSNYGVIGNLKTIEDFEKLYIKPVQSRLRNIPHIISKIVDIKRNANVIYINLIPHDPYNISIPMTIGLYQNEDNIENLTIEKVIKYFIYFHKKEIKKYCKKENIEEGRLFDHLFENAKKELALIS